jgi:uncharacterized membrane-anchored protein YhcB (DUF1043 family)
MRFKFKKIIFTLLAFFFLWLSLPITLLAVDSTLSAQPSPQVVTYEDFSGLKGEVQKLRSENYQSVLRSSQGTIDKINQYTDSLTFVAAIFGIVIGICTAILGINFYFTKKDFADRLKEIKIYVQTAKESVRLARENANLVEEMAKKAKKESNKISKLIEELKSKIETVKKVEKSKKSIEDKKAEIEELKQEIKGIIQNYNQSVGNLQTLNSQATILSGQPNLSQYPYSVDHNKGVASLGVDRSIDKYITTPAEVLGIEKCSECGKTINSLDDLSGVVDNSQFVSNLGEKLCSDCKVKKASKSQK